MHPTSNGNYLYHFIGQGTRAIAYRREFAEYVVTQKNYNLSDLWLLDMLSKMRNKAWKTNCDKPNMACLVDPPIFEHEPSLSQRFRDSGRLNHWPQAVRKKKVITFALTYVRRNWVSATEHKRLPWSWESLRSSDMAFTSCGH